MTALSIYHESGSIIRECTTERGAIVSELKALGVQFEQWNAAKTLSETADQDEVLSVFADDVERLNRQYGFQSVDVISLKSDNPKKEELRRKFLSEHTHADFEIRYFVDGSGLFYLHVGDKVYVVLCEKGDLISVPANTTHWFDMGENPDLKCIRFFTTADGWLGDFTGSDIAKSFPDFDQFRKQLS